MSWEDLAIEQTVENDRGKPEQLLITRIAIRIVADPANPEAKRFDVAVGLRIERSLFTVDVDLHVPVSLELVDGEIVAALDEPTHSVTVRFTLLGYLVGAALVLAGVIVGAIVGGLHGAVAGGAIAGSVVAALALLVVVVVRRKIGNAIGDLELTGTLTLAEPGLELTQRRLTTHSTHIGGGVVQLTTPVRFEAVPRRLAAPVTYQWRFTRRGTGRPDKGTALITGSLPPGSGIGELVVSADTCRVTNAPGMDVDGTVSVRATDAAGRTFTRSAPLHLAGTLTVPVDELPGGKPDPLLPEGP